MRSPRVAIVLLVLALTALAPAAFPQQPRELPKNRAEAVAALSSPSAAARASGIAWFAEHGSMATFSAIIVKRPQFAEGWNKRATAYYLAGQYEKSIADCGEVLKRNPGHFGALSGMGQIYFQLEQYDKSLEWFRRALEANPNMDGVELNIRGIEELLEQKRRRST